MDVGSRFSIVGREQILLKSFKAQDSSPQQNVIDSKMPIVLKLRNSK